MVSQTFSAVELKTEAHRALKVEYVRLLGVNQSSETGLVTVVIPALCAPQKRFPLTNHHS